MLSSWTNKSLDRQRNPVIKCLFFPARGGKSLDGPVKTLMLYPIMGITPKTYGAIEGLEMGVLDSSYIETVDAMSPGCKKIFCILSDTLPCKGKKRLRWIKNFPGVLYIKLHLKKLSWQTCLYHQSRPFSQGGVRDQTEVD